MPVRTSFALLFVALATGCGGGQSDVAGGSASPPMAAAPAPPSPSPSPAPPTAPSPSPAPASTAAATCDLADLPVLPADALDVRSFGAVADDGRDDSVAIQAALDALAPGQWLVFPQGTYEHRTRLAVRVPGAVLWSQGARLHATNAQDQAVMLAADGASIYHFTLTAVTAGRLHAPWQSRIAVFDRVERTQPLRGNVIRGNRLVNGGAAGSAQANSASSAGIFVYRAEDFVVAGNEVVRSLADGIHITAGSRNGRVLYNTVRETGDDMIAMVSYLGTGDWTQDAPQTVAGQLSSRREQEVVRNVLVAHNDVSGQYWGRGISVVGGADITIRANRIARTTMAAGVLLAREAGYSTFGVRNVVVEDNQISEVQTTAPAYTPAGWSRPAVTTGHAGIEVHAFVFDDERAHVSLLDALAVRDLRVRRNDVAGTAADGVRIGEGTGATLALSGTRADGSSVTRAYSGGPVGRIELASTALRRTAGRALAIKSRPSADDNIFCDALTHDGAALNDAACFGSAPQVSGASIGCR